MRGGRPLLQSDGFASLLKTLLSGNYGANDILGFLKGKPGASLVDGLDEFKEIVPKHRVPVAVLYQTPTRLAKYRDLEGWGYVVEQMHGGNKAGFKLDVDNILV